MTASGSSRRGVSNDLEVCGKIVSILATLPHRGKSRFEAETRRQSMATHMYGHQTSPLDLEAAPPSPSLGMPDLSERLQAAELRLQALETEKRHAIKRHILL